MKSTIILRSENLTSLRMTIGCWQGLTVNSDWKYVLQAESTTLCACKWRPSAASVTSTSVSLVNNDEKTDIKFGWWLFHRRQNCCIDISDKMFSTTVTHKLYCTIIVRPIIFKNRCNDHNRRVTSWEFANYYVSSFALMPWVRQSHHHYRFLTMKCLCSRSCNCWSNISWWFRDSWPIRDENLLAFDYFDNKEFLMRYLIGRREMN